MNCFYNQSMRVSWLRWCFLLFFTVQVAHADGGPAFDLDGPRIQAKVTRNGKTLPIGAVASLAAGDRVWVHPDLPEKEGARYVLVVAFLRGSVNPPPENWFIKAETWNKKVREEGINVTVPEGAQQVLLFLAPETGGDFSTLRNAVRGRPGAFVRASQDLHQASLDRSRLDTYLAAVKAQGLDTSDPKAVEDQAKLLARSLNIKVDQQCFDKPTEQQAPCLVQNPDSLVLDNGRSASVVQAATSGPAADMLAQMSYTQQAGSGYYSVYVGTVMDMAKILDSFHTAEYQYLPALAMPKGDTLVLKLNNPPSFHKPQSVLVVGLPAVQTAEGAPDLPLMRAVDPKNIQCVQKKPLVLQMVGAPYVFATNYAHDFVLRVQNKSGQAVDIPVTPDPMQGGFVVNEKALEAQSLAGIATGTLHGYWGFDPVEGPKYQMVSAHPQQWTLASADQHALIVGRKDTVHLEAPEVACVESVIVKDAGGKTLDASWKAVKPNQIQVDMPLDSEQAGALSLQVKQVGLEKPDQVPLHTYSEAGKLNSFKLYAGDHQGVLKGTRLDEVATMTINNVTFSPAAALTHAGSEDSLVLAAPESAASSFHPDDKIVAKVALKDGRTLDLESTVQTPRPTVKLMNKSVHSDGPASVVQLSSQDELPEHAKLTFFVQAVTPASFPRDQKIEVASNDSSFSTTLRVGEGGIVLQDSKTALVTLDPTKAFGGSAFGPLRFRPISSDGIQGDWQPLATLVRVPQLKELKCVEGAPLCTLVGTDLFLLDQVGIDAQLANAVTVPEGFGEATLSVPRPNGTLYLKLRDDPAVVNTAVLPVTAEPSQSAAVTPLAVVPAPAPAHQTEQKPAQPAAPAPAQPTTASAPQN
jgi:hypothetical protein